MCFACLARLLDLGFFRIGGSAYRRDHEAYGLTTLLREHARCAGGQVCFDFPGKSAQQQTRALEDPASFAVIRALLRRNDGPQLFVYRAAGTWHDVRAEDVNDYPMDRSGADLTAKDFRTWHATVLAAVALAVSENMADASPTRRRSAEARAVREVSRYLGNTPAVCRASYINPRVVELFENGVTIRPALDALGASAADGDPATHGAVEEAVRRLLRRGGP
ncbi:hypothetical protein [Streptomyces sp. NBC_01565]|uniref:hypothetical protein n=1 Tax=unclassified Streptomyces TaxID=2593676 RepID=UPI00225C004F|nr:hypothetical protein [Streptomyces sp. NBC_01565]MCX4546039.1 hypothetical protein [Streptomyces sp. NBC_01565]